MSFDWTRPRRGSWHNVYVHVPFCASKCGYCAFYSLAPGSRSLKKAYLDELEHRLQQIEFSAPVDTVYIGGGTPNFLLPDEFSRLIAILREYIPLCADCEVSCELNPEFLTAEKLEILRTFCTRLSMGVQSFDPAVRQKLMRRCSEAELCRALDLLRNNWDKHWNLDLIYGIAGEDWNVFQQDLKAALATGCNHLSCYALTKEENSCLGLDAPVATDEEAAEMWLAIGRMLAGQGMFRYEISNYARPGGECRHNANVWRGENLLGIGPAASGFDGIDRYTEVADLAAWLKREPPEVDQVARRTRLMEILAVNLRTAAGWSREQWEYLAPESWQMVRMQAWRAAEAHPEWWNVAEDTIKLTESGALFWDDAAQDILDWSI